jgi:hypothetical protein
MDYKFDHTPTEKEIEETIEYHLSHYIDYCRVWYKDGSKGIFKNAIPTFYCYGADHFIAFKAKEIMTEGSFGRMGIIRSKRYVMQIPKKS